ncbi:MAG: hypothetical protein ACRYGK_12735 [Janthinobacterium lividum]
MQQLQRSIQLFSEQCRSEVVKPIFLEPIFQPFFFQRKRAMPGNSSINDNNANIAAGKAMMGVWLSQTNTNNPINDYSVVMADLNLKLGSFLDVQKNYVKATSEKLNANNKLSRDILDFRAEAGAADRKLGQRNQDVVGTDASPGKDDAQVLARANDFIDRLHAVGIALDVRPPDSMGKEVKWTRIDELKAIPKTTSDDWGQKIPEQRRLHQQHDAGSVRQSAKPYWLHQQGGGTVVRWNKAQCGCPDGNHPQHGQRRLGNASTAAAVAAAAAAAVAAAAAAALQS